VKKLVKWEPPKPQSEKRQILLRIRSSSDSEEERIAHHSNSTEEAESLH
jgi:hypothetical protein